jgi:hypothetical protein
MHQGIGYPQIRTFTYSIRRIGTHRYYIPEEQIFNLNGSTDPVISKKTYQKNNDMVMSHYLLLLEN